MALPGHGKVVGLGRGCGAGHRSGEDLQLTQRREGGCVYAGQGGVGDEVHLTKPRASASEEGDCHQLHREGSDHEIDHRRHRHLARSTHDESQMAVFARSPAHEGWWGRARVGARGSHGVERLGVIVSLAVQ